MTNTRWNIYERGPKIKLGEARCFNCGKPCTDDDFCHGCREYVCQDCGQNLSLMGSHEPEDHLYSEDDE